MITPLRVWHGKYTHHCPHIRSKFSFLRARRRKKNCIPAGLGREINLLKPYLPPRGLEYRLRRCGLRRCDTRLLFAMRSKLPSHLVQNARRGPADNPAARKLQRLHSSARLNLAKHVCTRLNGRARRQRSSATLERTNQRANTEAKGENNPSPDPAILRKSLGQNWSQAMREEREGGKKEGRVAGNGMQWNRIARNGMEGKEMEKKRKRREMG